MITVFTPTFNRENTIDRVWNSLLQQSYTNFEWLIIDDGSSDNIQLKIEKYKSISPFPIVFYDFKENRGKHIATNKALELANGQFFVIADSDDAFTCDALQFFMDGWYSISELDRPSFCGIRACAMDQNGKRYSDLLPNEPIDSTMTDVFYKYKFRKESWCMVVTSIHRDFLYDENHRGYYPEGIIWNRMSEKYKIRFFNKATRIYFIGEGNGSIMTGSTPLIKKVSRNIILGNEILNNEIGYFRYYPSYFLTTTLMYTAYIWIGCKSFKEEISKIKPIISKCLFITLIIPGLLMTYIIKFRFKRKYLLNN